MDLSSQRNYRSCGSSAAQPPPGSLQAHDQRLRSAVHQRLSAMKYASLLSSLFVTACFSPGDEALYAKDDTDSTTDAESSDTAATPAASGPDTSAGSTTSASGQGPAADSDDGGSSGSTGGSSGSTGGSDDPGGTESADGSCPTGFVCGLDVPPGWDGPFMRVEGNAADACEGRYSELSQMLFDGLVAPPATCSCTCSNVQGATCSPANIRRYAGFSLSCGELLNEFDVEVGECQAYEFSGHGFIRPFRFAPSILIPGSCTPSESEIVESGSWGNTTQLCEAAKLDCEDGGCWPEGLPDAPLCITHEGEHGCPADFGVRSVLQGGVNDDRGCSSCSCGAPTGLSCDGLELEDAIFPEDSGPVTMDGNCTFAGLAGEFCFEPDLVGSCAASGGDAQGAATPSGATTVCCAS